MITRRTFIFVSSLLMLSASAFVAAQAASKPKLSASAVQVALLDVGDVQIPPEFRYAIYEQIVEHVQGKRSLSEGLPRRRQVQLQEFPTWLRCTLKWRVSRRAARPCVK